MREYKNTIIAVIVIVIAAAAFITVKTVATNRTPTATSDPYENDDRTVVICSFSPYNVSKLTVSNEEEIEVVRMSEDSWTCTTHPELEIYDTAMFDILTIFGNLNGLVVVDGKNEEINYKNFGLAEEDNPKWARVLLKDGTVHTVYLGKNNLSGSKTYIKIDDKDIVYSISETYSDDLLATRASFIYLYPFKFSDSDKINSVKMYKGNDMAFSAVANYENEEKEWDISKPVKRDGDAQNINALVTSLTNIKLSEVQEADCKDLSKYGLDVPDTTYVMADSAGVSKTVSIGDKTTDGKYYYCIFNGNKDVYTVETSFFTYKDTDLLAFMNVYAFLEQYTELRKVEIHINDAIKEDHVMEIGITETSRKDEEGNVVKDKNGDPVFDTTEELKFDGKVLSDDERGTATDENGEEYDLPTECELFKKVLTSLYMVKISVLELEQGEVGDTLLKIVYTRENNSTATVECKRRDADTMYVYLDGEYIGGYSRTSRISSDDIEYSIKNTIRNLQEVIG